MLVWKFFFYYINSLYSKFAAPIRCLNAESARIFSCAAIVAVFWKNAVQIAGFCKIRAPNKRLAFYSPVCLSPFSVALSFAFSDIHLNFIGAALFCSLL